MRTNGFLPTAVFLALIAITGAGVTKAKAETGAGYSYGGIQLGAGFPNNSQGSAFEYGAQLGYNLASDLSAAIFINRISVGSITSSLLTLNESSQSMTFFGIEGNRGLETLLPGLQLGVKAGLVSSSVSAVAPGIFNESKSNLHVFVGPKVSYDYGIVESITLGGEANFLFKTTSDEPVPGFATVNGVGQIFNLLATGKLYF